MQVSIRLSVAFNATFASHSITIVQMTTQRSRLVDDMDKEVGVPEPAAEPLERVTPFDETA